MNLRFLQKLREKLTRSESFRSVREFEKEMRYLASLPEPIDDIERSYCQYLTQKHKTTNNLVACIQNLTGGFLLKRTLRTVCEKKSVIRTESSGKPAAIFTNALGKSILPENICKEYEIVVPDKTDSFLVQEDAEFIKDIYKKYPRETFFTYKIALKVADYRGLIDAYAPKAIITTSEYSFTSSALTAYCERNGVKHINVMHGEKLADMTSTFFRFHQCYVWDEHYVNLFSSARAECGQFSVSVPPSLRMEFGDAAETVDYKFYLADETKGQLKKLSKIVTMIRENGNTVKIRPHPLYTNAQIIKKIFGADAIEEKKDIRTSIGESKNIAARFSTVLLQAYYGGKQVIIDDCTKPKEFSLLKTRKYILMDKPKIKLLSEIAHDVT